MPTGIERSTFPTKISITNLAERHLRPVDSDALAAFIRSHINHESSRKAFETRSPSPAMDTWPERISITNLAERHLRLGVGSTVSIIETVDINHESSRKAFETRIEAVEAIAEYKHINHESSRKAFETHLPCGHLRPRIRRYQSRI